MESCAAAPYSLEKPEWLVFLCTICALAEGTLELVVGVGPATCILTVLKDSLCRIAVMGGRDHMPRSLGSVYAGAVTRFLDGFRGRCTRTIAMPFAWSLRGGVAVSRDGLTLLIANESHAIHICSLHTGAILRTIGGPGRGPLQFSTPCQVWVASDGFVFVAEWSNRRIQILTPRYDFHAFVGVGQLTTPHGVCANENVIVVSEWFYDRVSVFNRHSGALIRVFGSNGAGAGQLSYPAGVCFMSGHRHVAVADHGNSRVSVWTLEGVFVRHVGVGKLWTPNGVACSDSDELVVADENLNPLVSERDTVQVFDSSGEIAWASSVYGFGDVALHGSMIIGLCAGNCKCVVLT